MRDNKPIETEAESYVCSRLGRMNLTYAKPNFDINGGDIIVINHISRDSYRSINVQVKGRDITNNNSNVKIHKSYVSENFVFFLYLRIKDDFNAYLYCFFNNDILNWELKDDNYYLNIPQKSIENKVFHTNSFQVDKQERLLEIIHSQKEKHLIENTEWNLTLLENIIRLWQTTGCLPDCKLTSWFLENTNPTYSLVSHNVFLTCMAFIHSDKLQTISAVDYMLAYFKINEIQTDATISDLEVVETFSNDWLIAYPKSHVELLLVKYNGVPHNALRLRLSDNEEQVESILIDNGDLTLAYNEY